MGKHYEALSKRKDSNLWEHCCEVHDGEMMSFGCEVTRSFKEDPLSRQLDEALRIQREEGVLMNDKNEWMRQEGSMYLQSVCDWMKKKYLNMKIVKTGKKISERKRK